MEAEKPRQKRPVSPTLPDGDLPSYMKATESYYKKVQSPYTQSCLRWSIVSFSNLTPHVGVANFVRIPNSPIIIRYTSLPLSPTPPHLSQYSTACHASIAVVTVTTYNKLVILPIHELLC